MSLVQQRNQLAGEFRELARQIDKLHGTPHGSAHLDAATHARWETIYGNDATNVLTNRSILNDHPATVDSDKLSEWIADAKRILPDAQGNLPPR